MNTLIRTQNCDPWHNLALEELLLETKTDNALTFYLWQNRHTVVIGRNQNAWRECRVEAFERGGGKLARRTSGGGAVYHDRGNLNFSFIAKKGVYDVKRQLDMIIAAMELLGIEARFTGRNDIVTDKGKFSGNAFCHARDVSLHHGTILVHVNKEEMVKYLAPPSNRLKAGGVQSIRSRVCNLTEFVPDLTIGRVSDALVRAFLKEYGDYTVMEESALPAKRLEELMEKHASWKWRCGATPKFDIELSERFIWGGVDLFLSIKNGIITDAAVCSDAMDEAFIRSIAPAIRGCRFDMGEMAERISETGGEEAFLLAERLANKLE